MVNALRSGHRTNIQQYYNVRLQERTKRVEGPAMTVDLLLVLFLHTEDNLRGHDALVRILELEIFVQPKSRRVFEEVSCDGLVVDHILHVVSRLVDT